MLTKYFKRKEFKNIPSLQLLKELDDLRISSGVPVGVRSNDFNSAEIVNQLIGDHNFIANDTTHYSNVEIHGINNSNYISQNLLHTPNPTLSQRILTIALMQVGFKEGKGNNNPYGQFFNLNYASWCSFFVHWVLIKAGAITKKDLDYSYGSARQTFLNLHTTKKDPSTFGSGELIVWGRKSSWQGHIGLILANDKVNDIIYTIEGNISNKVKIKKYKYNKLAYGKFEFLGAGNLKNDLMDNYTLDEILAKCKTIKDNKGELTR